LDTVRVEVAYVGGKELYSWPGENKFSDTPITRMVGVGMVGDGEFAVHAHNVFVSGGGIVTYAGPEGGLLRWDYTISSYESGWTVSGKGASQLVGSAGSFWVDAQTLDLVRMDNHATDFLPTFPLQGAVSRVDYGKLRIGEQEVLMPVRSEMKTVDLDGGGNRNVTQYSNCRQYAGQSTISFGALPPEAAAPVAPPVQVQEFQLPPATVLRLRLSQDLSLAHAAVGDPVEASLVAALRDGDREIVPRGAVVRGRVRLVSRESAASQYAELGLSFEELEFQGHTSQFTALLKSFDSELPNVRLDVISSGVYSGQMLTRTQVGATKMAGASVFFIRADSLGIPKGTLMTWVTAAK
jgi:hypothetical protein